MQIALPFLALSVLFWYIVIKQFAQTVMVRSAGQPVHLPPSELPSSALRVFMSRATISPPRSVDAVSFLRRLSGGSQSALIKGSDGFLYKAKFNNNPQGPNLLSNEWIGTALAESVGLRVAPSVMMRVSDAFLDQYPELCFRYANGEQKLNAGTHFGSLYLGQDNHLQRIFQYLPRSQRQHLFEPSQAVGIALFDILTGHADDRQAIFTKHPRKPKIIAYYIDFGHLFGGPSWGTLSQKWPLYHYRSSLSPVLWTDKVVFRWIAKFQGNIPRAFSAVKEQVPQCWHDGDLDQLEASVLACLEDFPNAIESLLLQEGSELLQSNPGNLLPTSMAR